MRKKIKIGEGEAPLELLLLLMLGYFCGVKVERLAMNSIGICKGESQLAISVLRPRSRCDRVDGPLFALLPFDLGRASVGRGSWTLWVGLNQGQCVPFPFVVYCVLIRCIPESVHKRACVSSTDNAQTRMKY